MKRSSWVLRCLAAAAVQSISCLAGKAWGAAPRSVLSRDLGCRRVLAAPLVRFRRAASAPCAFPPDVDALSPSPARFRLALPSQVSQFQAYHVNGLMFPFLSFSTHYRFMLSKCLQTCQSSKTKPRRHIQKVESRVWQIATVHYDFGHSCLAVITGIAHRRNH